MATLVFVLLIVSSLAAIGTLATPRAERGLGAQALGAQLANGVRFLASSGELVGLVEAKPARA